MKKEYKKLDKMVKFNYKIELHLRVESFGFVYISECIDKLYNKEKLSIRQIAKQLDKSPETILFWMRKWKFKRRSRGGNVKNNFLRNPKTTKKIMSLKGKMPMRAAAEIIQCCPSTIEAVWRKTTLNQ